MSKVNPEPNVIHIMGCYILGNPNGEKVRGPTPRIPQASGDPRNKKRVEGAPFFRRPFPVPLIPQEKSPCMSPASCGGAPAHLTLSCPEPVAPPPPFSCSRTSGRS